MTGPARIVRIGATERVSKRSSGADIFSLRLDAVLSSLGVEEISLGTSGLIGSSWSARLERWRSELRCGYPFYGRDNLACSELGLLLETASPHVVLVEHVDNAVGLLGWLESRRRGVGPPVILVSHGLHSQDFFYDPQRRSGLRSLLTRARRPSHMGRLLDTERRAAMAVDAVWAMSEMEAGTFRWLGARRVSVLPQACIPVPSSRRPLAGRFGFVGTLTHAINATGLELLIEALRGLPPGVQRSFELRIVGQPYPAMGRRWRGLPFVTLLGQLSDGELEKEIETWQAMVHPLFTWAKGKSMKVAIALEHEIPIVSTEAGMRAYDLEPGVHYLCAGDPGELAALICDLARKPARLDEVRRTATLRRDDRHGVNRVALWVRNDLLGLCPTLPSDWPEGPAVRIGVPTGAG